MQLNQTVRYEPSKGKHLQRLKSRDLIEPLIAVNAAGLSFKTKYPAVFTNYVIKYAPQKVMDLWFSDPLQLYANVVNFAVHCATSGLGICLEDIRNKQPLIASVVRFHVYYHIRRILYELKVKLPFEKGFDAHKTEYDKEGYREICQDYGVNDDETNWRNEYVFSTDQGGSLTGLNQDSWSRWIMPKSQGLTRQGVEMLSESIRVYVYCLLSAQSSVRSNVIGNTGPNFEAQKLFAKQVEDFVKRDMLLHEDVRRYEAILSNARSAVNFSLGEGIYMMPSDLQLKVVKKQGFSDKLKVGKAVGVVTPPPARQVEWQQQLSLREQRISKEHDQELQSLVLFGSLAAVGAVYLLKRK